MSNEITYLIEEDLLATIPSLEEAERRHAAALAKRASGVTLVEGVDYGFPRE
jgi:hypothetical protein